MGRARSAGGRPGTSVMRGGGAPRMTIPDKSSVRGFVYEVETEKVRASGGGARGRADAHCSRTRHHASIVELADFSLCEPQDVRQHLFGVLAQ